MADPRQDIINIILGTEAGNMNNMLEPVLNDILVKINPDDLSTIRDTLLNIPDSANKFRALRDADNGLAESFVNLANNDGVDDAFKATIENLKKGLQRLQLNILLSICKVQVDNTAPQLQNLIIAIQAKIAALNDIYIEKPESTVFKQSLQQQGGGYENYKMKYLKYKAKYLKQKNNF